MLLEIRRASRPVPAMYRMPDGQVANFPGETPDRAPTRRLPHLAARKAIWVLPYAVPGRVFIFPSNPHIHPTYTAAQTAAPAAARPSLPLPTPPANEAAAAISSLVFCPSVCLYAFTPFPLLPSPLSAPPPHAHHPRSRRVPRHSSPQCRHHCARRPRQNHPRSTRCSSSPATSAPASIEKLEGGQHGLIMDSNDLERERGITILSQNWRRELRSSRRGGGRRQARAVLCQHH